MNTVAAFPFVLPRGWQDGDGRVHREGSMRLANAGDELLPLKDHRVQSNPAYLAVILLSRVVTALGNVQVISPRLIEELPVADFAYLQSMYQRINNQGDNLFAVQCPECSHRFHVEAVPLGEP